LLATVSKITNKKEVINHFKIFYSLIPTGSYLENYLRNKRITDVVGEKEFQMTPKQMAKFVKAINETKARVPNTCQTSKT